MRADYKGKQQSREMGSTYTQPRLRASGVCESFESKCIT